MASGYDDLRSLIEQSALQNSGQDAEMLARLVESAKQRARQDAPEWARIIRIQVNEVEPWVYLYETPLRQFGILDHLFGRARDTEPSVDRSFLRMWRSDEFNASVFGKAYAKELGAILGKPFVATFSKRSYAAGDPGMDNGGEIQAQIKVSWDPDV